MIPDYLLSYSPVVQRQWKHVYDTVFKKTKSTERATKAANSTLKKRFKKQDSMFKNSRDDYMNMLVDSFLGNLK